MYKSIYKTVAAYLFTGAILVASVTACDDIIDPTKALIGTTIPSAVYPGDTVDYRVHNMSREPIEYNACQVPRLQSFNTTTNQWVTSTTLPTVPDDPCTQAPIAPWESVDTYVVLPSTLTAGTYRMVLINGIDGVTVPAATPFYTTTFTVVALPTVR